MPRDTAVATTEPADSPVALAAIGPYRSRDALASLEKVVLQGDLASLTPGERVAYYTRVCESLGLNPLTKPFDYIVLNSKLTLYANKDAAAQLRRIHGVEIDDITRDKDDQLGLISVTASGHDHRGRRDSAQGIVNIDGLKGEALANALMKAETKAKRRLTLSLAGLGWLDESELETIDETGGPRVDTRAEAVRARRARTVTPSAADDQAGAPEVAVSVETAAENTPEPPPSPPDRWMKKLHRLGGQLGLDHDGLHRLAVSRFGVASITELDTHQRADFMEMVEAAIEAPPAPVRANETGEADPPGAPAAIDAADEPTPPPASSAVEQPAVPAGEGGEPVAVAAENGSSTPSVGTPTSLAAFHIYAAAALGIEDTAGYELSELNTIELERVVETLGIEDYSAWFDGCSRELRAVLRNQKMSPKQRGDRQANAETEANLAAAGLTSKP